MVLLGGMVAAVNPKFLSINNLLNIVLNVSVTGIVCVGVSLILITGEFDLSLGPLMSILSLIMAKIMTTQGVLLGVVAVICMGVAVGAFNGFLVTRIRAHSFIITLGLMTAYKGAALLISQGYYLSMKGQFAVLGKQKLFGLIPNPSLVFVGVIIAAHLVLRYTKFGRLTFAIGGNKQAAFLSGIKVLAHKIVVYSIAGGLYGLATLTLVSQLGVAYPNTGDPYTLSALAAVVVGGVALSGGKGSALAIFLGALVFGLINNSMVMMNINPYWREVVLGLIILLAVAVSGFVSKE